MTNKTSIEWTDATWNPVSGCTKVSQGCKNCYAETWANRHMGEFSKDHARKFTDIRCHPEKLAIPLRWNKPRRIFVNSMSDLFHEDVPDEFIDRVFAVMALCPQHTFQILTKRPHRMKAWAIGDDHQLGRLGYVDGRARQIWREYSGKEFPVGKILPFKPLPHVWLGVSVEDQETSDERIPLLLQTPAAVRFVSAEPLLSAVDLSRWLKRGGSCECEPTDKPSQRCDNKWIRCNAGARWLNWIIVGGESGPSARQFDVQWSRDIVGQCKAASVPVFVKQIGSMPRGWCGFNAPEIVGTATAERITDCLPDYCDAYEASEQAQDCAYYNRRCHAIRDRKGADMSEWPIDLRVREFPK